MKVIITEAAWANMFQIGRWIGNDNPARAESFVSELYDRCENLASMPFAFPLIPDREESGIRRRPFEHYLIFYRVIGQQIEVLHVLHGATDYKQILFPEN